jgi:hypothetical protein
LWEQGAAPLELEDILDARKTAITQVAPPVLSEAEKMLGLMLDTQDDHATLLL